MKIQEITDRRFLVLLLILFIFAFQNCSGQNSNNINGAAAVPIPTTTNALLTDPTPSGITPSPQYTVLLNQGATPVNSFVYQVQNPGFLANGQPSGIASSSTLEHSTAWTSFEFTGPVTVQVTNTSAFTSARVLPSHAQITPTVSGNTVTFTITQPGQFAVDFCTTGTTCTEANDTNLINPMLVFANAIENISTDPTASNVVTVPPGLSVPNGGMVPTLGTGQNVLYFGPGIYDLGFNPVTVTSNETVFLARGAYVKGFFSLAMNAVNAAIQGRGILSGENLPKAQCINTTAGCPDMISGKGSLQNILIAGLTLIQSPFYNIQLGGGSGNTVTNVKIIAWLGNSDGIQASYGSSDAGSIVSNSFVKNGDDSIKLSSSNLLVENCVVWKMNNAAAFQMGANIAANLTNISVQNSDVIRSEYAWPNTSTAVFAANHGGQGNLSNYTFNNIRIENSLWQIFKVEILPGNFGNDNTQMGSISNLTFSNIQATDAQKFPALFRSFNLAHQISNITFNNVVVAGQTLPTPGISFNANRNASYVGNTLGSILFRNQTTPTNFEIPVITLTNLSTPSFSFLTFTQTNLPSGFNVSGSGDFFGDGYASSVVTNAANGQIGIWKEPYLNTTATWASQYSTVYTPLSTDGVYAGTGDFNGDGYEDILFWNSTKQTGKILFMKGDQVLSQTTFQPTTASTWSVASVGDFNGDGLSDVLLRDTSGNLEIVFSNSTSTPTTMDFKETTLNYSSTANYTGLYGATTGKFDTTWNIAATGIFQGLGTLYAAILWVNPSTGQVGLTNLTPFLATPQSGEVFAKLPANTTIQEVADFNGDGGKDLLLWNSSTSQNTIWFMNFYGGAIYQVGPTLNPSVASGWSPIPN